MSRRNPATILAAEIDENLGQAGDILALQIYKGTWIRSTRHALGWVLDDLGRKLKMSKQALLRLEERELESTISIRKLEEVAEAMNCELVYCFVPAEPLTTTATDLERRQEDARRRHRTMPRPV